MNPGSRPPTEGVAAMWWGVSLVILVVLVIGYAEWRDRRGDGRSTNRPLTTITGEDTGHPPVA